MYEKTILKKIKKIRKNSGITLQALSKMTGLTQGYLSRIENAESAPPIATLNRLARVLGIPIEYLLSEEKQAGEINRSIAVNEDQFTTSKTSDDGKFAKSDSGYQYLPLAKEMSGKNMQPYVITFDFEMGPLITGDGELFIYVIDGKLELVHGTESYVLDKGGNAYLDTRIPHNGRSIGKKKALVLIVAYSYRRLDSAL